MEPKRGAKPQMVGWGGMTPPLAVLGAAPGTPAPLYRQRT